MELQPQEDFLRILTIGKMGTGKSSFCQSICDIENKSEIFKASSDTKSCT
jgi:septin family protein